MYGAAKSITSAVPCSLERRPLGLQDRGSIGQAHSGPERARRQPDAAGFIA
jgi:hypothetical protein